MIVFLTLMQPQEISTAFLFNPSAVASNKQTALFALPLSGGACTRIFTRFPTTPASSFFEAFGITLTNSFTPSEVASTNDIMHLLMFFYFANNDGNVARICALHRELLERVSTLHYFDRV